MALIPTAPAATTSPDDYRRRIAEAQKYIPGFGIAGPCGYGRLDAAIVPSLMKEHVMAMELYNHP